MTGKPNIVLIFTDQQRADTMGYAGDPVARTPNTDRLAGDGVVFRSSRKGIPIIGTIVNRHNKVVTNLSQLKRIEGFSFRILRQSKYYHVTQLVSRMENEEQTFPPVIMSRNYIR